MLGFSSHKSLVTKSLPTGKSALITVLDVGTTKICCIIAKLHPREAALELTKRTHTIEIVGFGHQRSRGIKGGVVVDLNEAEQAIRLAVDAAERQARMTVESIIVNMSGNRMRSETFSASVSLAGHAVRADDIQRVIYAGRSHSISEEMAILHSQPIGYSLDGTPGIKDPLHMAGERLGVDMHCLTVNEAALRNLETVINRCHIAVEGFVATPYASGLACLTGDETELGVVAIDMGGGTTTASIFYEGEFIHYDGIAIGGQHATTDLARGLSTTLRQAEFIKVKYGSVLSTALDDGETISIPPMVDDADGIGDVPISLISKIIRPRLEETFELVRDRLNAAGYGSIAGRRIVLTGGACQLNGVSDLAREILAKNVRLGRPLGVTGLPLEARGAAFSSVVGLMIYPQLERIEEDGKTRHTAAQSSGKMTGTEGYFGRVGRWLSENF